jgi:type II secretory pathway predicted ATPase ExeA
MINHRSLLTPEVLAFFGLRRDPFAPPRSPAELFTTPVIECVYAQLEQAVRFQGFVCLLAPVGAGKTMLKNRLIAALGPKSKVQKVPGSEMAVPYECAERLGLSVTGHLTGRAAPEIEGIAPIDSYSIRKGTAFPHIRAAEPRVIQIQDPQSQIPNPKSFILSPKFADMSRLTAAGIVAYVLEELGVKPRRALVLAQKQLEQRLAWLAQNNITVALCFDECHHLNDTLLTALKNFYELGTGGFERYLGLILLASRSLPRASSCRASARSPSAWRASNCPLSRLKRPKTTSPTASTTPAMQPPKVQGPMSNVQSRKPVLTLDLGLWTLDPLPIPNPKSQIPNRSLRGPPSA